MAFISDCTRESYYKRLRRTGDSGGVVLPLGADALGPRLGRKPIKRPMSFSVIGTIEPRKNHELILDAFEPLLREVRGLSLTFMGAMGWVSPAFNERVCKLAATEDSKFKFFSAPTDASIRQCIEDSRATIYVSSVEGFGLPPLESLWSGTPVIASTMIPSLERVGTSGVHIVDPLSVVSLRRAIQAFLDDGYAERKKEGSNESDLADLEIVRHEEALRWCAPEVKAFRASR